MRGAIRSSRMKWLPSICSNVAVTEMDRRMEMTNKSEEENSKRKQEAVGAAAVEEVNKNGECADVVVRVNGEQEFRLQMLPLVNASGYFRDLRSKSSGADDDGMVHQPTGCKLVAIYDLPGGVEGFAISVDMCYLLNPKLTGLNVALVCAAAEFLAMDDVVQHAKAFMHTHIFSHWRSCIAFLTTYTRLASPVDDYVEAVCNSVVESACVKFFAEARHLSAPSRCNMKQSSGALTEILVQVCSLPDAYVAGMVDYLVDHDVNLNLKCRQGRNVRRWLEHVLDEKCESSNARGWILVCLSRMLLKNVPAKRPWMELSTQFWCGLLEQTDLLVPLLQDPLQTQLKDVKTELEHTIGRGLDEIDDYLRDYKFRPPTLLSLVETFVALNPPPPQAHRWQPSTQSLQEIAADVDQFLWFYAEERSIPTPTFLRLFQAFPQWARPSHDTVYGAIQKLMTSPNSEPNCTATTEHFQLLLSLIDHSKLTPALSPEPGREPPGGDPDMSRRSEVVANAMEEEEDLDGVHLRRIMQKVIDVSLMLLEENSQRSKEILALQKQFGELLDCRAEKRDCEEVGVAKDSRRQQCGSQFSSCSEMEESEVSETNGLQYESYE